jgi:hypothetical protein
MSNYEILNEFIDGDLPPELEPELFAQLSTSEEFRSLMKHTIALNRAAKSPSMMSQPPAATTHSLFSALGIAVMPDTAEPEIVQVPGKRRYLPMISTIAAAILVMILLTFSIREPIDNFTKATEGLVSAINKSVYPVISSVSIDNNKALNTIIPRDTIVKYVYVQPKKAGTTMQNEVPDITSLSSVRSISGIMNFNTGGLIKDYNPIIINRQLSKPETIDLKTPVIDTTALQFARYDDSKNKDSKPIGVTVEVRGSQNWLNPEPNIEPKKKALFNNNSLALMYSITDEIALGTEIRQENFFQKYQGYNKTLLSESIYEQQPNFTSGGVFIRYTNTNLGFIKPFVQATGGANETGYISRAMAGLVFNPANSVSIILGYEYSRLFYNFQGKGFTSDKKSFNYGMSYSF